MPDGTELQFNQILQAIRDQGQQQVSALDRLGEDIKELVRSAGRSSASTQAGKNGGWQSYAIILSLFIAVMGPTWGVISSTRDEVQNVGGRASANLALISALDGKEQRMQEKLTEIETQFSWISDAANVERQHNMIEMDLLRQCPNCKMLERTYWPLNVGKRPGAQ